MSENRDVSFAGGVMTKWYIKRSFLLFRWPIILCSTLLVGWLDHVTGVELSFSFFYLLPVAASVWWFGRGFGMTSAFLCASTSWTMDWVSDFSYYRHPEIALLNALLRYGIFATFAFLLDTLKRKMGDLDRYATHDLYTGILNSRGFYLKAREALLEARETGRCVALSYIDLDNFKQVNDRFGHLEGDRLLKLVADELRTQCDKDSFPARIGGDEFVILSLGVLPHELEGCLQEIRSKLNGRMQAEGWPVTFTIGAVSHEKAPGDIDPLVKEADDLMYQGKRSGKNSLRIAVH